MRPTIAVVLCVAAAVASGCDPNDSSADVPPPVDGGVDAGADEAPDISPMEADLGVGDAPDDAPCDISMSVQLDGSALPIVGEYRADDGSVHWIEHDLWEQQSADGALALFRVVRIELDRRRVLLASADAPDDTHVDRWDWVDIADGAAICRVAAGVAPAEALAAPEPDSSDLATGCAGGPWLSLRAGLAIAGWYVSPSGDTHRIGSAHWLRGEGLEGQRWTVRALDAEWLVAQGADEAGWARLDWQAGAGARVVCVTEAESEDALAAPDRDLERGCHGGPWTPLAPATPGTADRLIDGSGVADAGKAVDGVRGGGLGRGGFDVAQLNYQGGSTLVLGWSGRRLLDGPGVDFVVFENGFRMGDDPARHFMDVLIVEVSADGEAWFTLPHDYVAADETQYSACPGDWLGFAGVWPTLFNVDENPVDPFLFRAAGGDGFDLAALTGPEARSAVAAGITQVRLVTAPSRQNPDTGAGFPHDAISNGGDVDGVVGRWLLPLEVGAP